MPVLYSFITAPNHRDHDGTALCWSIPPPQKKDECVDFCLKLFTDSRRVQPKCATAMTNAGRILTSLSLSSLWATSSFSRASPHPLTISSTVSQGTLSMCLITSYSIWSQVYVCRPIRSFCSCVSCFMFNVGPTAWLCFMSDSLFYWFTDWLHCIDLFRCIAASLFSKLTYLLAFYVCKVITATISCIDTD